MKRHLLALWMLTGLATIGCQGSDGPAPEQTGMDNDVIVAVGDIPQNIKDAAIAAAPGLVIEEAELEENGTVYCIHGHIDGTPTEVEVSKDGEVLEIESGDDDEDDDDDEDSSDDDDEDEDEDDSSPNSSSASSPTD